MNTPESQSKLSQNEKSISKVEYNTHRTYLSSEIAKAKEFPFQQSQLKEQRRKLDEEYKIANEVSLNHQQENTENSGDSEPYVKPVEKSPNFIFHPTPLWLTVLLFVFMIVLFFFYS